MTQHVLTSALSRDTCQVQRVLLPPGAKFLKATATPGVVYVHHLVNVEEGTTPVEFIVGTGSGAVPVGFDWVDTIVVVGTEVRHIYRESRPESLCEVQNELLDEHPEPKAITDDTVAPTGLRYTYTISLAGRLGYILKGEAPIVGILSLLEKYTQLGALGQHHFVEQLNRRGYARTTYPERDDEYILIVRLMA